MAKAKSSNDPRKAWHTRTMIGGAFIVLVSTLTLFDNTLSAIGIVARIIGILVGITIFEAGRRRKD